MAKKKKLTAAQEKWLRAAKEKLLASNNLENDSTKKAAEPKTPIPKVPYTSKPKSTLDLIKGR